MATIAPPMQSRPPIQSGAPTKPPVHPPAIREERRKEKFSWRTWWAYQWEQLRLQTSNDTVSFASSMFVHVLLILLLALITTAVPMPVRSLLLLRDDGDFALEAVDFGMPDGDTIEESSADKTMETSNENLVNFASIEPLQSPVDLHGSQNTPELSPVSTVATLAPIELAKSSKSSSVASPLVGSGMFAGSSMEGRSQENRRKFGMQNGASKESEAAVDAALVWFAAHQSADGSWSTAMTDKPCNGRCTHGTEEIGSPKRVAATGLALLCFLGAGHTQKQGPYKTEVYKGLQYLTGAIKKGARFSDHDQGRFLSDGAPHEMYEQGIAVLALCEAYQMTKDTTLRSSVEAGIGFIERAQHRDGSWGYEPHTSGDLSIVSWQIMALKSAHQMGIRVNPEVVRRTDKYLDSVQSEYGSFYGYRSTKRDPCMTAIGLMLRLYRGWPRTDSRILDGAQYILDLGPSTNGVYYDYYATQLLFHLKHPKFKEWNELCRDYFVKEQAQEGHEKGSWYMGKSHFNQVGGRLYCTAMATLTLEVYYRFMPIHTEVETDTFAL